ncbi:DUF4198 domain-containing protein [Desulfobacter curvatus]|uniref:DUF4198 domain-containing protein n=1 Tax=Desulfobacter curvatus TaxID=2290 RepID=UPI00036AA18B|nr:DUF4198 domain-containing protein [Desulfobacter curvatus]
MLTKLRTTGLTASLFLIVCLFFIFSVPVPISAHELWVQQTGYKNGVISANIGYGHEFPNPESIPADRLHIFSPLALVTQTGTLNMDQTGENYAFERKIALKKGSYMVLAFYKPTFWSNGDGGWEQTDRIQRPGASYVEEAVMYGKTIVNVDGATDTSLISKPTGMDLDIVPLANPATIRPGKVFPMQVLLNGKPAHFAQVEATFDHFAAKDYIAFSGTTDAYGHIDFIPLKAGYWIVRVKDTSEYPDKKKADERVLASSLTFTITD